MNTGLLQEVRTNCRAVAEMARFVRINLDRIPSYAASLPLERIVSPAHDPDCHYLGQGDDTVAFFLTLDAVNFGSGYFPSLKKRPGMSGYFTVAASLNDLFRRSGPLSAHALSHISPEECAGIFGQDLGTEAVRELMELFAKALNDLGRYLLERFGGSFTALVQAAGSSAERLAELLIEMPFFNDVEAYGGLLVPFYKRAQIVAADLFIAFSGEGPGRFYDLDRLTIFADNLVPHVLRVDGILSYGEGLAALIDAEEPIPAGSAEEVEIRACAVHAVELLVGELRRVGHPVTAMGVDNLLWNRGQDPRYKSRPRHRTRSVYY